MWDATAGGGEEGVQKDSLGKNGLSVCSEQQQQTIGQ